jgi:MFS family permease
MFILAGILAWNLMPSGDPQYSSAISFGTILRFFCIAIFGLISGFVADRFGRRSAIIFGLTVLGASFLILGLPISELSVITYLTGSGVAWGSFLTMYLVVPGDLSSLESREKLYAFITVLPLIVMGGVPYIPGLATFLKIPTLFLQILSLLLFLSIIPVWRAQETLPESKINARRLKVYLNKMGKVVEESRKEKTEQK